MITTTISTSHPTEEPASPATAWFRQRAVQLSSLGPRRGSSAPFSSFASTIPYSPLPSASRKQAVLRRVGSTREKKGVAFQVGKKSNKAERILGMSEFDIVLERERSPGAVSTFQKPEKISTTKRLEVYSDDSDRGIAQLPTLPKFAPLILPDFTPSPLGSPLSASAPSPPFTRHDFTRIPLPPLPTHLTSLPKSSRGRPTTKMSRISTASSATSGTKRFQRHCTLDVLEGNPSTRSRGRMRESKPFLEMSDQEGEKSSGSRRKEGEGSGGNSRRKEDDATRGNRLESVSLPPILAFEALSIDDDREVRKRVDSRAKGERKRGDSRKEGGSFLDPFDSD